MGVPKVWKLIIKKVVDVAGMAYHRNVGYITHVVTSQRVTFTLRGQPR